MENKSPQKENQNSDEIDFGQLVVLIKRGFNSIFIGILKTFIYLKKRALVLLILILVGVGLAIGLNQFISKKLKTEVIVKPNLESKNYLYDVVSEIGANIKAKDTAFFNSLGVDIGLLPNFEIEIAPLENQNIKYDKEDIEYLELLEKFRSDLLIQDVIRTEILNKSTLNHRITFSYRNETEGRACAEKLISYINSNNYYNELVEISLDNARERIKQDEKLIAQIDQIIERYSDRLSRGRIQDDNRIIVDDEEQFDLTGLLNIKNSSIRDIENKKLEMQNRKEAIRIISFGRTHEIQRAFFGKKVVYIPGILVLLLFIVDLSKYFNKKSKEMKLQ